MIDYMLYPAVATIEAVHYPREATFILTAENHLPMRQYLMHWDTARQIGRLLIQDHQLWVDVNWNYEHTWSVSSV